MLFQRAELLCLNSTGRRNLFLRKQYRRQRDNKQPCIIVDGVHQSLKHLKTYTSLATRHGYSLETMYPPGTDVFDVPSCHKHSIHKVPYKAIQKLKSSFEHSLGDIITEIKKEDLAA